MDQIARMVPAKIQTMNPRGLEFEPIREAVEKIKSFYDNITERAGKLPIDARDFFFTSDLSQAIGYIKNHIDDASSEINTIGREVWNTNVLENLATKHNDNTIEYQFDKNNSSKMTKSIMDLISIASIIPYGYDGESKKYIGKDIYSYIGSLLVSIKNQYPEFIHTLTQEVQDDINLAAIRFSEIVIGKSDTRTKEATAAQATSDTATGLKEADEYWETKRKSHRNWRWIFLGVFILISLSSAWLIFQFKPDNISDQANLAPAFLKYFSGVALPALLVAWVLRLISRQFITHHVLEEDALLRTILIRTFLSLRRNPDSEIADKERTHMLESIFRPLPTTPTSDIQAPNITNIGKLVK